MRELARSAPALLAGSPAGTFFSATIHFAEGRDALPYLAAVDASGQLAVLGRGDWEAAKDWLDRFDQRSGATRVERPGPPVAVLLPARALDGCLKDSALRATLETFVREGGRLIVLPQSLGGWYRCLPRDEGQPLLAFGADQDSSDQADAVYADGPHPLLGSRGAGGFSAKVAGYFEALPDGARVVLRRTRDRQACLAHYRFGEGLVVLTTLLDGLGRPDEKGPGAPELLDDLVEWALAEGHRPEPRRGPRGRQP